ncbi:MULTISPECIES: hypothetical protein [Acinetobacter calcoaceticus/baumannii complex]|uniref:hypothetical protein n=1 Tax=Acinetobacter calcoaceticus/baumannii complex TaxID=909768 RepID=UPI000446F875|nr:MULTISPECIES: hypothetical protein [Acinetobacter calcoaceticus/baumannii complex]AUT34478.1 hypothetical protein C2U64_11860 [Acinetobacter pittii]EXG31446.1 hypothetical protein J733_2043 [Acinetobacter sp. 263903-2]KRJ07151.1 hypothetical protein APC76_12610 [Acinetobacter pittii]MCE6395691.1 hypothetical protein [Acinetobacter pittii]OTS04366.1 hypothetical protein CAT24_03780 [Acinetobacter pittii]
MNIYKMHVDSLDESKTAIQLFTQLGYFKQQPQSLNYNFYIYANRNGTLSFGDNLNTYNTNKGKRLTIPTLQDLVVLHRKSPEDANYSILVTSNNPAHPLFKSSEGVFYSWGDHGKKWIECKSINDKTTGLKKLLPKGQPSGASTEFKTIKVEGLEGLVDGKAALTAALAGETVQISVEPWEEKNWDTFNPLEDDVSTKVFFTGMSEGVQKVFFRIKPKTILINGIEVPAPFRPKEFEDCYLLHDLYEHGYVQASWKYSNSVPAWRTEEEIKQVVAALRKVFEVQP